MAVKKAQRCTCAQLHKFLQRMSKGKEQQKQVTSVNSKDRKALVIAHEIKFVRLLASNDKVTRDRVLKKLRKWLTVRSQSSFAFVESDFMRLWKGLFYCTWMSDKPLVQEELTESLSKIVHCFKTKDVALLYTACALRTLGIEWFGIDQYRLDKFYMLTRRIIRQTFEKCKAKLWDMEWIKGFCEILENLLVDPKICIGFNMHVTEIFLEELSKISGGDIPENVITELIKPFITYFIPMDDERQIRHVMRHVFRYLIIQSDVGMDYAEKFRAWRDAGFPAGSIDAMERIELSDKEMNDGNEAEDKFLENQMEDNKERPLDPRAGKVDVELPQIPFDAKQIADLLNQYKFHPSSTTKSRRQLRRLIKEFTEVSQNKMPLGIKEISIPDTRKKDTDSKSAAIRLLKFEKELYSDGPQRKRKRKNSEQLIEDESSDKFDDELNELEELDDLDDIDDENDSESNIVDTDESEIARKKEKTKHKLDGADNLVNTNAMQTLVENGVGSKKKKCKAKEKNQSNCEIDEEDGSYKSKRSSSLLIKSTNEGRKAKLKRNKIVTAKPLNVVAQAKRKKLAKRKITGKWDVSDNIDLPTTSQLNGNSTESSVKTIGESDTNDYDTQLAWFASISTKLENEKKKTATSSKGQHKIRVSGSSKKRVKIALQRNTAQHTSEYMLQIRRSPAIPFDANKKPLAGVLKASPIPSPINPFYRRNI